MELPSKFWQQAEAVLLVDEGPKTLEKQVAESINLLEMLLNNAMPYMAKREACFYIAANTYRLYKSIEKR